MSKKQDMQFGHVNTYARAPKAGKKGTAKSVKDILGEAMRVTENCPHVPNPKPPVHIAGMTIDELGESIDRLLDERKIEGKKKPRGDIHVLAAAVYSWPEHVDFYDKKRLDDWIKDQIEFHKKTVGKVDSVVLHLDESFPHIHVYTVDPDARRLVPGHIEKRKAEAQAREAKESDKDVCKAGNAAFKTAMTEWQDSLFDEVGKYHGLERLGPKRQRLPRPEWRAAKEARLQAGDRLRKLRDDSETESGKLMAVQAEIGHLTEAKLHIADAEKEIRRIKRENELLTIEADRAESSERELMEKLAASEAKNRALEAQIVTKQPEATTTPAKPLLATLKPLEALKEESDRASRLAGGEGVAGFFKKSGLKPK
jgi:hypothetical protein